MDKALKLVAVLAAAVALAGCPSATTGSLCHVGPFITDPGATTRLTRGEKEQVRTLNLSGETICGWKAP